MGCCEDLKRDLGQIKNDIASFSKNGGGAGARSIAPDGGYVTQAQLITVQQNLLIEIKKLRTDLESGGSSSQKGFSKFFNSLQGKSLIGAGLVGMVSAGGGLEKQFADLIRNKALQEGLAKQAPNLAREFEQIKGQLNKNTKVATEASTQAAKAGKDAATALSQIIAIATALAAAGIAVAGIKVGEIRGDALEGRIDSTEAGMSKILGLLNPIKRQIERLEKSLQQNNRDLNGLNRDYKILEGKTKNLNDIAAEARSNASKALAGVERLDPKVKNLNDIAAEARSNASKALVELSTTVTPKLKQLNDIAAEARSNASKALVELSTTVTPKLKQLNDITAEARSNASKALTGLTPLNKQISEANAAANKANAAATKAINDAATALKTKATPGPKGDKGATGERGLKGDRGERGPAGATGATGLRGATGAMGAPGATGLRGAPGVDGRPGRDGVDGKPGVPGVDGRPGRDGVDGKPGVPGVDGRLGRDGRDGKDGKDGKDVDSAIVAEIRARLNDIQSKVTPLPALAATVNKLPDTINNVPNSETFKSAVANGTCRTLQPGGCMRKEFDGVGDSLNKQSSLLDKLNAAMQALDLTLLTTINNKLGSQIPNGGISGLLNKMNNLAGKTWDFLQIDRVLSVLTYITALHNAYMLSNNLAQTLFSAIGNVLDVFGIKDKEGSPLDVGQFVSQWTENFFKRLFGVAAVEGIKAEWKKLNRIYQAASNVIWSVQSIFDSMRSLTEIAIENTGKIGNALRRAGVVFENAYSTLTEKATARNRWQKQMDRFTEGVEVAENVISNIDSAASEVKSIQDTAKELKEQQKEFKESVKAFQDSESAKEAQSKIISKAPQL